MVLLLNLIQIRKLIIAINFIIFLFGLCTAQNLKNTDSLWTIIKRSNNIIEQAKAYVELSEILGNNHIDTIPYLCNKAIALIEVDNKLSSNKNANIAYNTLGLAYNNLGVYTAQKLELKKALPYFEKSLAYYKKGKNYNLNLSSLSNLGITYRNLGEYKKAIAYFNEILELTSKEKKPKEIASALHSIAQIHYELKDYTTSILYGKRSLKIAKENNLNTEWVASLSIIGNSHSKLNQYDSALVYLRKARAILSKIKSVSFTATIYNNLGNIYNGLNQKDSAYFYLLKAIELNEKNKAPNSQLSVQYNNLSRLLADDSKYNEAIEQGEKAYKYAAKSGNIRDMYQAKEVLNISYGKIANYKAAFYSLDEFIKLKDSALSESNKRALIKREYDLEAKLQTEKLKIENIEQIKRNSLAFTFEQEKQKIQLLQDKREMMQVETVKRKQLENDFKQKQQVELLLKQKKELQTKEETKRQNLIIFSITFLFIVLALFAYILFRRFQVTKKQKDLINEQKKQVEIQKHLVDEKNKEIFDSITYAKRLQEAILPPLEMVTNYLPQNFILYKPKDIVAGDFYWMEVIEKNNEKIILIAVADSTGHGVPGAMVSIVCSNALNRAVKEFNLIETGKILNKTRDLVLETFEKSTSDVKDGMDISLLSINYSTCKIAWSGANNPLWFIFPPTILNTQSIINEVKADKQPIGKSDYAKPFTTHEIPFVKDSIFYLFTDGFADQFGGPKGKKFKYSQFSDILKQNQNQLLTFQSTILNNSFINWKGDLEQVDDVCVIGIKI